MIERLLLGGLAGDGPVLDRPIARLALPAGKVFAVEHGLETFFRIGGRGGPEGGGPLGYDEQSRNRRQGEHAWHGRVSRLKTAARPRGASKRRLAGGGGGVCRGVNAGLGNKPESSDFARGESCNL